MTDLLMLLLAVCAAKRFLFQTKQYLHKAPISLGHRAASHGWRFLLHLANCNDLILQLGLVTTQSVKLYLKKDIYPGMPCVHRSH